VQRTDGLEAVFSLGQGSALSALSASCDVGEKRKLKVAAGDKLLLQANAARKHFVNGELVEVKAVQGESIVLADGRVIPQNYRTFTHGYAVTSHAAQGKTVDEVLVVASARSLPAVSREQFYVSISRGRERCRVFTDDTERLRSHVAHSGERLAAVEAVPRLRNRNFIQRVMARGQRFLKEFRQRIAPSPVIQQQQAHEHQPVQRIRI
jgi:ATP-dependent exoDNAse (exonuclease V) alpha subunit